MDLRFFEMHFEELKGVSDTFEHNLLCMSASGETFCAMSDSDSVFHIRWEGGELKRRPCYKPKLSKPALYEIVLLHALSRDGDTFITLSCVYYTSSKYVLAIFSLDLETLKIEAKQEEVLHSKPNLLHVFTDIDGSCVVFLTFYLEPCTAVFVYQGEGGLHRDNTTRSLGVPCSRGELLSEKAQDGLYIITVDVWVGGGVRYVACGTVDGSVHVTASDKEWRVLWRDSYEWEGPIADIRFVSLQGVLCLVAACAVEQVVLFTHLREKQNLSRFVPLPDAHMYDSPTCLQLMDIDYDRQPEILVGTYGGMLLVYKITFLKDGTPKPVLRYIRNYNSPLFSICYSDVTSDGLFEILLLSHNGIHVLQRCLKTAAAFVGRLLRDYTPTKTCPFFSEHYG
eukprot:sb/3465425/